MGAVWPERDWIQRRRAIGAARPGAVGASAGAPPGSWSERSARTSPQRQRLLIGLTSTPGPAKWPVRASLRRWARSRDVTSSRKSARGSGERPLPGSPSMRACPDRAAPRRRLVPPAPSPVEPATEAPLARISTPSRRAMASRQLDSAASPAAREPSSIRRASLHAEPHPALPDLAAPEARGVCSSRCPRSARTLARALGPRRRTKARSMARSSSTPRARSSPRSASPQAYPRVIRSHRPAPAPCRRR